MPIMPFPVYEEYEYECQITTIYQSDSLVEDYLELQVSKRDEIDTWLEQNLKLIWGSPIAQEVMKFKLKDLEKLSFIQCEEALKMILPVIKSKSDGRYILGT